MQLNNNSPSPVDIKYINSELNIDPQFIDGDTSPFSILGKRFSDIMNFNGGDVLTGSMRSIGISGTRPKLSGKALLKDDFTTEINPDNITINHNGKRWSYSLYNFPYVDGLHRKIRSTTVTVDSHLLLEIVSADKCLYWIVAPMGASA